MERASTAGRLGGRRRVVVVLGAHRSGTSALTRVCNLLGMSLGEGLLPRAPDNETGFWELREIVDADEAILAEFGLSHLSHRALPREWHRDPRVAPHRDVLKERIRREATSHQLFGTKDPRICRLLPLWREILDELNLKPAFVCAIRNPMEVARSLERRNHLPLRHGQRLWLRYNIEMEYYTRGSSRSFVYYPELLRDWRKQIDAAQETLGLDWPRRNDERAAEAIERFLRPQLRHHDSDCDDSWQRQVDRNVRQAFVALRDAGSRRVDTGRLDTVRARVRRRDVVRWLARLPRNIGRRRARRKRKDLG